jgi:hypothetical protein
MNTSVISQHRKGITMDSEFSELAHRERDGLAVTLFWSPRCDEVSIRLVDKRAETDLAFVVANDAALDAFNHPYAYALAEKASSDRELIESAAVAS